MKISDLINTGSKILKERNIRTHQLDSEIILSHILKKDRESTLINENEITKNQFETFNQLLTRRLNNEPVAYIINKRAEPTKPNSSEKSVKIKSVCFSGKNSK